MYMSKVFVLVSCLMFLASISAWAGSMTANELRQIAQAGGSLILDMDEHKYSVTELVSVAKVLSNDATLTIRMGDGQRLTLAQCLQITKARPGRVRFWLVR